MSLASKIPALKDRALCFQKARSFFFTRNILEVDTPLLSKTAPIDEHIDIFSVALGDGKHAYLHSSPEYALKRLLSLGIGDIYQMSHVFRQGEMGTYHNPEFTLVEWYRVGADFPCFIEETVEFMQLFLGNLPHSTISYREAFLRFTGLDYLHASQEELFCLAQKKGLSLLSPSWDKEALLHLFMGCFVEPNLGQEELLILTDYPASQAALAETFYKGEEHVAKRFEIYYKGLELCNGYLELTDPKLQRKRLIESQEKRALLQKDPLPIDELFLKALEEGLPSCCGVAVGFDRLLLLRQKAASLQEVIPFSWQEV